jgi:hypothetical protein
MSFMNVPQTSMPCPACHQGTMYPTGYADLASSHLIGWKCDHCSYEAITGQPLASAASQVSE